MPNPNGSSFTSEEVRKFADVLHDPFGTVKEKQVAVKNLRVHFELKFEGEEKVLWFYRKILSLENEKIDESGPQFLEFKMDYKIAFSTALEATLKYIESEQYTNNNPDGLFITILNRKIIDTFRRFRTGISQKRKENLKENAKKQPTINDFYKKYDTFKKVIDLRNNSSMSSFKKQFFEGANEEQIDAINNVLFQFKDTFNVEKIWQAIVAENHRCFYENNCTHCESVDTCLKHLIMIWHKRDKEPYETIQVKTPFKAIRQIISKRYIRIKLNFWNFLQK
jgi:hypothetical protein